MNRKIITLLIFGFILGLTVNGQQSKIDQIVKQINFKLKVQSTDEGKTEIQADNTGDVIITRTIQLSNDPKFKLNYSFNFSGINMTVELMPTEVPTKFKTYILYFRCKPEKCVRFENDNGLTDLKDFADLIFRTKENADKMNALFMQLKSACK